MHGPYWVAFERSAYQLHRAFPDSETTPLRLFAYPFPIVMVFIGPRPERKFYIDQIMERDPRYRYLYQIRPGVTSYATLYNGYTDTVDKMLRRLRYDLFYLEHRSWLFDFKILVKTFLNIAFGKKF